MALSPDDLSFSRATSDDIERLVGVREEVMRVVWGLPADVDLSVEARQTREYYEQAIPSGRHASFLVHDGPAFVGCAGISYYRVMPTPDNPTGRKAYVMNMYVRKEYRRRGIASRLLELLLQDADDKGVEFVALEASEEGRPFYAAHGFVPMPDEMLLKG
ncbi:MAG: GNAT family N-acetyltransferase [Atopobiaceae bacterium]|jgi:GNAT superfamily N-acetyltransferase|nr:GNAT family N-acetyltransferase [Atopobiaceae bacterium]